MVGQAVGAGDMPSTSLTGEGVGAGASVFLPVPGSEPRQTATLVECVQCMFVRHYFDSI